MLGREDEGGIGQRRNWLRNGRVRWSMGWMEGECGASTMLVKGRKVAGAGDNPTSDMPD